MCPLVILVLYLHSLHPTIIVAETPAVNASNQGDELTITVEFLGGHLVPTGSTFLYKGNPTIETIYPLTTIVK